MIKKCFIAVHVINLGLHLQNKTWMFSTELENAFQTLGNVMKYFASFEDGVGHQ